MNSWEKVEKRETEKVESTADVLDRICMSSSPNKVSRGEKPPYPVNRETGKIKITESKYETKSKRGGNHSSDLSDANEHPVERKTKHLTKTQRTMTLGRPLTRIISHTNSTIVTKISDGHFNDSLSEAFRQILSAFDEKSVPQHNEDLLVFKTLERHLRCLQTVFIEKYESLSKQNNEGERKSYKFVAVIENESGRLVIKESETKPMFNFLPAFSVADFELKLKRCFTDMMSSFVDRVKTYLKETSQKDFEQMMKLFESEQNKQCSLLLDWLAKKSKLSEEKFEPVETKFYEVVETQKDTGEKLAKELETLTEGEEEDNEESRVFTKTDMKTRRIRLKLNELKKSKKTVEDKLKGALEKLERERNAFENILKGEKKKHAEFIRTQEEKIKSQEECIEKFEAKTVNLEETFVKINENLEQQKRRNASLTSELFEMKTKENEFKEANTDLTEKLNSDAQAQGTKIQNLREKLKETEEILQNLRKFNIKNSDKLEKDTEESDSTKNLINEKNEEIMNLKNRNVDLQEELEKERKNNDLKLADITNELKKSQEHESDLQKLNLELEGKLEITETGRVAEIAQLTFKLKEKQELSQELQSENSKLKKSLEQLRKEKDGAKTRLLSKLKESQDRVNKLKELNKEITSKCNGIENEKKLSIGNATKELADIKISQGKLKELNAQLKEGYEILHKKYKDTLTFTNDVKEIRQDLKELKQIYADIFRSFQQLDEDRCCTIKKLTKELIQSTESIQNLQGINLEFQQKIANKEYERNVAVEQLVNTINGHLEQISKLEEENKDLKEQVSKQAESQGEENHILNKALNESLNLVSELTEKLTAEKDVNEKLQEELNESRTRTRDLELVYAELSKKIEDDGQESSLAEEMLNDLIESRKMVKELEIRNEELKRKIQILDNRSIGNYSKKYDRLRAEKRDLRTSIDEHLEKLGGCNEAISTLKQVVAHKDETLELKTKHIETLKREIRDLFRDLESLREMVLTKNKQIGRLETKLSTSSEHFQTLFNTFGHKHAECFEFEEKCRVMRDSITRANKIRKNQEETIDLLKKRIHQLTKIK